MSFTSRNCRAGELLSEHLQKLQNCVRIYGGVDAQGIIVSAFNLAALADWDVPKRLAALAAPDAG
jgi:hypothetical protein